MEKKEVLPVRRNNMGEPGGHHAQWNKPDATEQTLHDSAHRRHHLKESNHGNRVKRWFPRDWDGRGKWELLSKGYEVSVLQDEQVLEVCCKQ